MKTTPPLSQDKKLTVRYRVEPGCLGPKGDALIEEFCRYAQNEVESFDADFVHWNIVPRHDKSLAEMEYTINNKKLSHDQAAKYLHMYDIGLDEVENRMQDKLVLLIDTYMGRE